MSEPDPEMLKQAGALVRRIRPLLAGLGPQVQSLILADLIAEWLAGHRSTKSADDTASYRAHVLNGFFEYVVNLVPIAEAAQDRSISRRAH